MTAVTGTEKTPVEVTPSFSKIRAENLRTVQQQLLDAGLVAEAARFVAEYHSLVARQLRRDLTGHPITLAAEAAGVKVRWVK